MTDDGAMGVAQLVRKSTNLKSISILALGGVINDSSQTAANLNNLALASAWAKGYTELFFPGGVQDVYTFKTDGGALPEVAAYCTISGYPTLSFTGTGLTFNNYSRSVDLRYSGNGTGAFSLIRASNKKGIVIQSPYIGNSSKNGIAFDTCSNILISVQTAEKFGDYSVSTPTEGAFLYAPNCTNFTVSVNDGSGSTGLGFFILTNPVDVEIRAYVHDTRLRAVSSSGSSTGYGNKWYLKVRRTGYLNKGSLAAAQNRLITYATYVALAAAVPPIGTIGYATDTQRYYDYSSGGWNGNGVGTNMVYAVNTTDPKQIEVWIDGEDQGENFCEGTMTLRQPILRNNAGYDTDLYTPTPGSLYTSRGMTIYGGEIRNGRGAVLLGGVSSGSECRNIVMIGTRLYDPRDGGAGYEATFVKLLANGAGITGSNILIKGIVCFDSLGAVVGDGISINRAGGAVFDPSSVIVEDCNCPAATYTFSAMITKVNRNSWQGSSDPFNQSSGAYNTQSIANVSGGGNKRLLWSYGIKYNATTSLFDVTSGTFAKLMLALDNDKIAFYVIPNTVTGSIDNTTLDTYYRGYVDQTGLHSGGAAYNSIRKFWLGTTLTFWKDGAGRLRVAGSEPGSDAAGNAASQVTGTTAQRPSVFAVGDPYFDTTLNKPIWRGNSGWVDSTGTAV